MDAIGLVWPSNAETKLIDLSVEWRQEYHKYWFDKWFYKARWKLV